MINATINYGFLDYKLHNNDATVVRQLKQKSSDSSSEPLTPPSAQKKRSPIDIDALFQNRLTKQMQ